MAKRPKKVRGEDWNRDTSTLAGRITTEMEDLKLTPTDLSDACGVSVTAVGWWLRGESKNLKLEHFFSLAETLKVEPRWLGINKGPKRIADAFGAIRRTLEQVENSSAHSPPASETSRVTDSTVATKSRGAVKKS